MLDPNKQVYTPKEVAKVLGVSVFTVHELLRDGSLKAFKITSRWRVKAEELERFMQDVDSKKDVGGGK